MAVVSIHREPLPFPLLVALFAVSVSGVGLIRKWSKTPPLSAEAERLLPFVILAGFIILAALNAYGNWRLGRPQF